jgi:hypothetical protein
MSVSKRGRLAAGTLVTIVAVAASAAFAQLSESPDTPHHSVVQWSVLYTDWGRVTGLESATPDTMSITLDPSVPFVNSSRVGPGIGGALITCKNINAGYALDPTDPGVKAHEAVLLAAFIAGKKVRLLINQCVFDKPRVIAVGITD